MFGIIVKKLLLKSPLRPKEENDSIRHPEKY